MDATPSFSQTNLFDFLVKDDRITWQTMLMDAVKQGDLNPWDIDIQKLADQFLHMLNELKQMNFTLSGKIVLAAALLLRLKSKRFISDDIANLDRVIAQSQEPEYYDEDDTDYDDLPQSYDVSIAPLEEQPMVLYPRTPQPRRRKVSIYDLVTALDKALEVKNRRKILHARPAPAVERPKNVIDIGKLIEKVYGQIEVAHNNKTTLYFSSLIEEQSRSAKINTFVPLLHLSNARRVRLTQKEPFADFLVELSSSVDEKR